MTQARIETINQTEEIGLFTIRFEGDIATEWQNSVKIAFFFRFWLNYCNYLKKNA